MLGVDFSIGGMELLSTDALMSAQPKPQFNVFTYHFYGAASVRMIQSGPFSIKPENALSELWLKRTDHVAEYYAALRDK